MLDHLPKDWRKAALPGGLQAPGGPLPVLIRNGRASESLTVIREVRVCRRPIDRS